MTKDEFLDWFRHHGARFTGIRAWLDKLTHGHNAPSEADVMRAWFKALADVSLDAARDASDRMHAGTIEEPRGYDRHPAAIRKACGVSRPARAEDAPRYDPDGNQTYGCLLCRDCGWVTCWSTETAKKIQRNGFGGEVANYTCSVRCSCRAGDRVGSPSALRFNPSQYCVMPWASGTRDDEARQSLLDWLTARAKNATGYENAFEAFSGSPRAAHPH